MDYKFFFYYMAKSVSRKDELNPVLWLATKVGKIVLSCPFEIIRFVPQEKFPEARAYSF